MSVTAWLLPLGIAAVIAIIGAESFARSRLRDRGEYYVWAPGFRRVLQLDREALPWAAASATFQINSAGERGDEPPDAKQSVFRILIAGGSAVECMLLDQAECWTGLLQRMLDCPEHREMLGGSARVHVGSIGKSDVDSQALDRALRRILPRYARLDVLVILVGASNVVRWLAAGAPADAPAPPVPELELFDWQPNGPFGWYPNRMALAELARRLRFRVLRPTEVRERAGKFMTRLRRMRARARLVSTISDPTTMLDAFDESFRSALRIAIERADRVIVARQPWLDKSSYTAEEESRCWHGMLGNAWEGEVREFVDNQVLRSLMAQLDARAAAASEELGVEQIDLRRVVSSDLSDYYDFLHFTPAGAEKVARAVAECVLADAADSLQCTATGISADRPGEVGETTDTP